MRSFLLILAGISTALCNAQALTDKQLAQLPLLRAEAERACLTRAESRRAEMQQRANTAYRKWATEPFINARFCACTADRYVENPTRELFTDTYGENEQALARQHGYSCALSEWKQGFPRWCPTIADELGVRANSVGYSAVSHLCACVQNHLNDVDDARFPNYLKASGAEYQSFQLTGNIPSGSAGSFFAATNACGLKELRALSNKRGS